MANNYKERRSLGEQEMTGLVKGKFINTFELPGFVFFSLSNYPNLPHTKLEYTAASLC